MASEADCSQLAARCGTQEIGLSLTYLGHSAFKYEVGGLTIYTDPYIQEPCDWRRLPKGDLVLLTHGHFDHGVQMAPTLYDAWKCKFVAPKILAEWMRKKFKRSLPADAVIAVEPGQTIRFGDLDILVTPAHHPMNRLGKTILTLFARSNAPGNPVNGYYFAGYYQSGDTIYTPDIPAQLKGKPVNTAVLPIGGKYKTCNPQEALQLAEEIGAKRLVPCHWQPLQQQVWFRYQPSHLVKLGKSSGTSVEICPLAIGEVLPAKPKAFV
ncbi:MAG TPA: MBL fold metallo-hydrolase [Candidatus Obscuribacterales bacterium]